MSSRLDIRQTSITSPARGGTFTATISSDERGRGRARGSGSVIVSKGHETWSDAARRGVWLADAKGIVLENRALIDARIAEGK